MLSDPQQWSAAGPSLSPTSQSGLIVHCKEKRKHFSAITDDSSHAEGISGLTFALVLQMAHVVQPVS